MTQWKCWPSGFLHSNGGQCFQSFVDLRYFWLLARSWILWLPLCLQVPGDQELLTSSWYVSPECYCLSLRNIQKKKNRTDLTPRTVKLEWQKREKKQIEVHVLRNALKSYKTTTLRFFTIGCWLPNHTSADISCIPQSVVSPFVWLSKAEASKDLFA